MKGWIKVITFTYSHEALLAKTYLEALGINSILKDELTIQVHHFLSNTIGGVKLFVEVENKEEALALLEDAGYIEKDATKKKVLIERFPAEYKTTCPYCKETNVALKKTPGYIYIASILFPGFPLPVLRKRYLCFDCLREWKIEWTESKPSNKKTSDV